LIDFSGDDAEDIMLEEQEAIDDAAPLSEIEQEEKNRLLDQGFDWTKRDFNAFIAAMETYGRNDLESIMASVPAKEPDEVKRYK
jgi:HAND